MPEGLPTQDQYFVDETEVRLLDLADWSSDGKLGDIDGDGDLDIVIATPLGERTHCYFILNDGEGYFPEENFQVFDVNNYDFRALGLGDLERDGDLDVYLGDDNNSYQGLEWSALMINYGNGAFVEEGRERLPNRTMDKDVGAEFVDIDGDGDLDLSLPGSWSDRLWTNVGMGHFDFHPQGRFPSGNHSTTTASWGDLDGDFDADCVLAYISNEVSVRVMINDGNGWFTDESFDRLPVEGLNYHSYGEGLIDIEGDGDLDIVVGKGYGVPNKLWVNDGNGYFIDESSERLIDNGRWDSTRRVKSGDVDNDGDFDLFLVNGYGEDWLFINDGKGYFTNETEGRFPSTEETTETLALGDLDNDGDLDCFVVKFGERPYPNTGQNQIFINISTPDSFPPVIPRTYHHPDTKDTLNPYLVTTTVWDNITLDVGGIEVSLLYRVEDEGSFGLSGEGFYKVPMPDCGGFLYRGWIPAQPNGTSVSYYIRAKDRMGNTAFDPPDAPESTFNFRVDAREGIYENGE